MVVKIASSTAFNYFPCANTCPCLVRGKPSKSQLMNVYPQRGEKSDYMCKRIRCRKGELLERVPA